MMFQNEVFYFLVTFASVMINFRRTVDWAEEKFVINRK